MSAAQLCATLGLTMLAPAVTGVVLLIFTVAAATAAGTIAAAVTFPAFAGLWAVLPLAFRRSARSAMHPDPE